MNQFDVEKEVNAARVELDRAQRRLSQAEKNLADYKKNSLKTGTVLVDQFGQAYIALPNSGSIRLWRFDHTGATFTDKEFWEESEGRVFTEVRVGHSSGIPFREELLSALGVDTRPTV